MLRNNLLPLRSISPVIIGTRGNSYRTRKQSGRYLPVVSVLRMYALKRKVIKNGSILRTDIAPWCVYRRVVSVLIMVKVENTDPKNC